MGNKKGSSVFQTITAWAVCLSLLLPAVPVQASAVQRAGEKNASWTNGQLLDLDGKPVQAYGGEIHQVKDENGAAKYYWIGRGTPDAGSVSTDARLDAVRLYSSSDLYNWKREKDIFRGMSNKEQFTTDTYFKNLYKDLNETQKEAVFNSLNNLYAAYPKVFYNQKTQNYVMWAMRNQNGVQSPYIATSNSIKGPFKFEKSYDAEQGMSGRFIMYQDSDGTVYAVVFEADGSSSSSSGQAKANLSIMKLTDNYLNVDTKVKTEITVSGNTGASSNPLSIYAYNMEGSILKQNGRYYMFNNLIGRDSYAVADAMAGPWTVKTLEGNPKNRETASQVLRINRGSDVVYISISKEEGGSANHSWLPIQFGQDGGISLQQAGSWTLSGLTTGVQPADQWPAPINDRPETVWPYRSIHGFSDEQLLDTNGNVVQANGGGVYQMTEADGQTKYYWYGGDGFNALGSSNDPGGANAAAKASPAVHLYSSDDLYNWTPEEDLFSLESGSGPARRSKILYNEQAKNYVLWVSGYQKKAVIATGTSIKGPFRKVGDFGQNKEFVTLYQEGNGDAYVVYRNAGLGNDFYIAKLNQNYTDLDSSLGMDRKIRFKNDNGYLSQDIFDIVKHNGRYYMAGPDIMNGSESYAVADYLFGVWTKKKMEHIPNSPSGTAQKKADSAYSSSSLLKIERAGGVIYMNLADGQKNMYGALGMLTGEGWTVEACQRYAWLPLQFSNDGELKLMELYDWTLDDVEIAPTGDTAAGGPVQYRFFPGVLNHELLDMDGNEVLAYGGEVHRFTEGNETKWYWIGKDTPDDTGVSGDNKNCAIHLYSSNDLYNWTKEKDILTGNSAFGKPKMLKSSGKYVLWVPVTQSGSRKTVKVYTSSSIKGPFTEGSALKAEMASMALYQGENGDAYVIYDNKADTGSPSAEQAKFFKAKLTPDYTNIELPAEEAELNASSSYGSGIKAEGSILKKDNRYYYLIDYESTAGSYLMAEDLKGPWTMNSFMTQGMPAVDVTEPDKYLYPSNAGKVLKVECETGPVYIRMAEVRESGPTISPGQGKWRYVWIPVQFNADGTMASTASVNWKYEGEKTVEVTGVQLAKSSATLKVGETCQIQAEAVPAGASDRRLAYTSGSTAAKVSTGGVVTAAAKGTAVITVSSKNGKTASFTVTVEEQAAAPSETPSETPQTPIAVTGVQLAEKSKTIKVGETYKIQASVLPANATDKSLTYASSNSAAAAVSADGTITALKKGAVTITVSSKNNKKASFTVTIAEGQTETPPGTETPSGPPSEKPTEPPSGTPADPSENPPSETPADPSENPPSETPPGTETPSGPPSETPPGTETPSGPPSEKPTGSVEVIGIRLTETGIRLTAGEKYQIQAKVIPANATEQALSYASSDTAVAAVSGNGTVTANKAGMASIIVSSKNGKKAAVQVIVDPKEKPPAEVEEILLVEESKTLQVGETYRIWAEVLPEDAADQTLSYISSAQAVASVSEVGVVTANAAGTAVITVSSANGKTDTMQITVVPKVVSVEKVLVSPIKMTVGLGEKVLLAAAVYPKDATDQKLTYIASNNRVKTDSKGRIYALKTGSCKIAILSSNNKKAIVTVTVKKSPGKISLNAKSKTLKVGKTFKLQPKLPGTAASYSITYSSSKKSVAAVSNDGKILAKKKGNAVITAQTYNGKKATIKITVK